MNCFRCRESIIEGQEYFVFSEFSGAGKLVKEDFAHKVCWNKFLTKLTDVSSAQGMLRGLNKKLKSMGMLDEEEEVIRI